MSQFLGELTAQVLGFPSFPTVTAQPGTKTSDRVACFFNATNSLVFVPGCAVGKLGNSNLSGKLSH